ncbi:MAG: Gfo/Idh/MocA family oxidoreductase [Kiritimatiellae bacterium]|nr:Gfo/Idh/MocA family oxidoreductase [Kiritimatiellia bacterium]
MSTSATPLQVGIVGCGLIGRKRAAALGAHRLVACTDLDPARAAALAAPAGAAVCRDAAELVARADVDVVIVATTHDALATTAVAALLAGKHVLVEKPAGRTVAEVEMIQRAAAASKCLVHVGFNHRYHPAVRRARELFEQGALGPMMMVRGRYGHGGRPGYEREWRADPIRSGGGELIDQGVHLIDLARWFLGDFTDVRGLATTLYWAMPVDDNAFLTLRTAGGQVAFLHASCSEWKNLFSLEIYGRSAKLHIEGLGGSYGVERLAYYRMKPEMGPPETTIWEFPGPDDSWAIEWAEFAEDIRLGRTPACGVEDARAVLAVVETVYRGGGA